MPPKTRRASGSSTRRRGTMAPPLVAAPLSVARMWQRYDGPIHRSVFLNMPRLVMPYHRQTQRSKHADPKAVAYNAWKGAIRTEVADLMRRENIDPFPDEAELRFHATITLATKVTTVYRTNKIHTRTLHPANTQDASNLGKGLEDAIQGALFKNDVRVFDFHVVKAEGDEDHLELLVEQMATTAG